MPRRENLARYIIRASFSQERMTYIAADESADGVSKVIYESKDANTSKTFDALDWLAQLVTHIPNKGEQMVRYYGFYSNKSRGLRKKAGIDDEVPALIDSDISRQAFRKNWARLIQKIYNVDPLLCPKCSGSMNIISFIDDSEIVKKILKHLNLWDVKRKPPPRANGPPTESFIIYDESSSPGADDYIIDANYPIDLSRRSSKNEDGNLHLKKSSRRRTGELYSNRPEFSIPSEKLVLTTNPALVIRMVMAVV
jgi:hypothetical protein